MQYQTSNWDASELNNFNKVSSNIHDCIAKSNSSINRNCYDNNNNYSNYNIYSNSMNSISNNDNNTSFISCNVPSARIDSRCTGFDNAGIVNNNALDIICENDNTSIINISNNNVNVNKLTNRYNKQSGKEHDNNVRNGNDSFTSVMNNFSSSTNSNPNGNNNNSNTAHNFNVPYNHSDTNLFFRHLPHSIDDFTLRHIFSAFGSVLSAAIMRDIHTGESLGTAFVRFEKHEDALAAMKYYARHPFISFTSPSLTELSSQELMMSSSSTEPTSLQASSTNHTHSANKGKNDEAYTRKPLVVQWAKKVHDDAIVGAERLKRRKLFVRNIPTEITEEAILALMQPFGLIEDVTLHEDTVPPPPPPSLSQSHQSNMSPLGTDVATTLVTTSTTQKETVNDGNAVITDANNMSAGSPHESSSAFEEKKLIAFITFAQDGAAAAACEAVHNTCPFPECNGIPFMAKLADPNRRRHEAFRNHHQGSHHNHQQHDLSYNHTNTSARHGHSYKTNMSSSYRNNISGNNSSIGNFTPVQSGVLFNNYTSIDYYANSNTNNSNILKPFQGNKEVNVHLSMNESSTQNTPFLYSSNNNNNDNNNNNIITDAECCSYIEQSMNSANVVNASCFQQDASLMRTQNDAPILENTRRVSYTPHKPVAASTEMSYNNHAMPYYHTNVPTFPLLGETNMTPKMKEEEHDLHSFTLAMESCNYNPFNSLSCTPNEQCCAGASSLDQTMPHYMNTPYTCSNQKDNAYHAYYSSVKNQNNLYSKNINKSNSYSFISLAKMGLTSETSCLLSCDSMTNSLTSTHHFPLQQQEQEHNVQQLQEERQERQRMECELSEKLNSTTRSIRTTQSSPALSCIRDARNDMVGVSIYAPEHIKQLASSTTRPMTTLETESNYKWTNDHEVNCNRTNSNHKGSYRIHTLPPVLCLSASYDRAEPSAENMNSAFPPASTASASGEALIKEICQEEKTSDLHFSSSTSGASVVERTGKGDVPRYRYNPYNLDNPRQIMNSCHNSTPSTHTIKQSCTKTEVSAETHFGEW